MMQFLYFLLIFFLISITMMILNFLLSKKIYQSREKISPFECGFDPISNNHIPFSVHFFLISLIFLIFDIEIALLIPLAYLMKNFNMSMIMTSFIFLLTLIIGLYIEYSEKSIDWKI